MHHDFIIVGSGGAGLSMALFLSQLSQKAKILVLSKTYPMGSHTTAAKGGINASLGNIAQDAIPWHIYDTTTSGKGLCDTLPTQKMCEEAPHVIEFLSSLGVDFDKTPNGAIDQRVYGGQTTHFGKGSLAHRACFVKDYTGHEIMQKLLHAVQSETNITLTHYTTCLSLHKGKPHQLTYYDHTSGALVNTFARTIIFATGGFTQIYQTTSSSSLCTGCGHRILFESGFVFKDIELVQFHPTGIETNGMLISEACRSEGGFILNSQHERIMQNHPMKELAPRDIIAKTIHSALNDGKVYLDLRHIPKQILTTKLVSSYNVAKYFANTDLSTSLLSIAPTAHYNMGGIEVDEHYHAGDNIYTIGELACASVHGANRLGCNSLLELFTSAKIASAHAHQSYTHHNYKTDTKTDFKPNSTMTEAECLDIQKQIKETMQRSASVSKDGNNLQQALNKITHIYNDIFQQNNFISKPFNTDFITLFETQSLALMAKSVLHGALARQHSIGAHFREDYPTLPETPQHTILSQNFEISFKNPS